MKKLEYIISFETSAEIGGCALIDSAGTVIHEVILAEKMKHGELLAPAAKECLGMIDDGANVAVAVDLGPGSYTGQRVGVITAKAFAFAAGAPIVGVVSLDAIAFSLKEKGTRVLVVTKSRKNEYYSAEFLFDDNLKMNSVSELQALSHADAVKKIKGVPHGTVLAGSAVEMFIDDIDTGMYRIVYKSGPSPVDVARLGKVILESRGCTQDIHEVQPLYPRKAGVSMPVLGEPLEKT
ncbi:MAG: tRNA (adenosine(37)-N6)-threonylcarbamoyltransferase complex dimerization subunit type 1 TsaB [Planctomycetota bacterium]